METLPTTTKKALSQLDEYVGAVEETGCNITCAIEAAYANTELKTIKGHIKEIDELRKSLTRPLDESKARIIDLFRPTETKLKALETALKGGLLSFKKAEDRRVEEEERELQAKVDKAREALAAGDRKTADETMSAIATTPKPHATPKLEGSYTRKTWKFRIIDPDALPREYMMPNEKLLGMIATQQKGNAKVAGVEFYEDEGLSVRG